MAAPKGNSNAEKWNIEKATKLIDDIIKAADQLDTYRIGSGQNTELVDGYKFDFIGELSLHFGVYRELITRDIPNRFEDLKDKCNLIIRLMERNCYSNTKKGIINTAVGIVNLKSNHNWTDRSNTDITTNGESVNQSLPTELISKLIDKL